MRVLVANFFPAFHPPRSGGEQRYYYFYRHLSRYYDITLLSPTYAYHPFEVVTFSPNFRELRVPKDGVVERLHWELHAEGIGPEFSAYVVALAAARETEYSRRFTAAAIEADVIIHESPFTLPYDKSFGSDGKPRIYNAYNVEHRLAAQILHGETGRKATAFIGFLERSLSRNSSLIFATSEEDRELLAADFDIGLDRIVLAPNGFEPSGADAPGESVHEHRNRSSVVFIGSGHPPNVAAGRFILETLAPALPDVEFRILGTVCDKLPPRPPANVRLLGFIDEAAKRRELASCAAAINPLFYGSGTNLKMLDYLASGAPVVTTMVGARGLSLADGVTAFVCAGGGFAERLSHVLADPAMCAAVGNAGREKALAEFTWARIAEGARVAIDSLVPKKSVGENASLTRRSLLVVNDFPVAQATGGGEVRIRELLTELGRDFDVVLLCLTQEAHATERRLQPHVREIRIPKTSEHRDAEILAGRGGSVSVNDLLAAEFCNSNAAFVAAFRQMVTSAAAVIFEHPYLAPLADLLPHDVPIVYSSLNVEHRLKAELLRVRRDAARWTVRASELERGLLQRADLVICVSDEDRNEFRKDVGDKRYLVVENGVRAASRRSASDARRPDPTDTIDGRAIAVFVGSAHPPNAEAARYLLEVVAPALPTLAIAIAGSVCSAVGLLPRPPNVHLLGTLTELEKNGLFARADLALNPMFQGGGSSLKVPDFFASGLPLVSTGTGVRGYHLRNGEHYLEANRETFVARTRDLVLDCALRDRLGTNARRYAAAALDWEVLGRRYRRALKDLTGYRRALRVLFLTYRFTDPPLGGAETYSLNVVRQLGRRGNVCVDVATYDVDAIADKWHFSAEYHQRASGYGIPSNVETIHRFPIDPPDEENFARCTRLFEVWMAETREQSVRLGDGKDRNVLLGGWNFPERQDGKVRRWTSRESRLQVDPAATAIRIIGYMPRLSRVDIRRDGRTIASRMLNGRFEWDAELGVGDPVLTLTTERGYTAQGDPRVLGFVVDAIALHDGTQWRSIALDEDFESISRRSDGAQWVRSLVETTNRRSRADDDLFFIARGPHSAALERWLEANIATYDVVLAQGTPFATPVTATEIASRHGVPVVLLPHFHMEDRYYHWRRYYDAFRSVHRVIAAPESVKSVFFDAIGAASVSLPGGGVDPDEFDPANLMRAEQSFQSIHLGSKPFVLVLGRKTGAKNYRMVVDAVSELNRAEHRVDLVLIGRDEDGLAISDPHVFVYGTQRRSVVLGALKRALCLVNMSESESFGIVLLESWFAGRPVIAQQRCMAFADLVVSGRNGVLVETVSQLAAAIDGYLRDESVAAGHVRNGHAVAQQYSWANIAERIEQVLIDACHHAEAACSVDHDHA